MSQNEPLSSKPSVTEQPEIQRDPDLKSPNLRKETLTAETSRSKQKQIKKKQRRKLRAQLRQAIG